MVVSTCEGPGVNTCVFFRSRGEKWNKDERGYYYAESWNCKGEERSTLPAEGSIDLCYSCAVRLGLEW